jgi:hypothetical protein
VKFAANTTSLVVALALLLSGCGGNGSATGTPAVNPIPPPAGATGQLHIIIPPRKKHKLGVRRPAFVSPSTKSLAIVINGARPVILNVAVPPCTTVSGGGLSCVFSVSAPLGKDTIVASLYDKANATGTLLGSGSQTLTVTSGGFGPTITIVAVVGHIVLHLANPALTPRVKSSTTLTVNEVDPDGNTITGTYGSPITLASADATGAVTVSPARVTQSGTAVTVKYSGSTMMYGGAGITATAADATQLTATFSIGTPCAPTYTPEDLYATWDTSSSANILQFVPPYTGTGSDGGSLTNPVYANIDPSGNIFYAQANTSGYPANTANVVYFSPGFVSPTSVTPSDLDIYGTAVDDRGDLFVSENNGSSPSVFEMVGPLPPVGSNYGSPVQMPNSPALSYGLLFDKYCNLFVDGQTPSTSTYVKVFGTTGQTGGGYGQLTPTSNTNAALPGDNGMALDSHGNLFVAGNGTIVKLAPPYTGTPVALGFSIPGDFLPSLAFDANDDLIFADYSSNTIGESSPPYSSYSVINSGTLSDAVGVVIGPHITSSFRPERRRR